jgi:hypothetical protein
VRHLLAAAVLTAAVTLGTGCGGTPSRPAAPARSVAVSPGAVSPGAVSPGALAPPECATAHRIINEATAAFTAQVDRAVAAGNSGDTRAQAAAMAQLRSTFDGWSKALSTLATKTADAGLRAVLADYAGAVAATIARVHQPADLEQLATFDDRELDIIADRFAAVCP